MKRIHFSEPVANIAATAIVAKHDFLVSHQAAKVLQAYFRNIAFIEVDSGHFILQAAPHAMAKYLINIFIRPL